MLYFLLQLTVTDIISLCIGCIEILYVLNEKWTFSVEVCSLYSGLETFTNTATIYFLITISLHALSTANLALSASRLLLKRREYEDDDNDDSASTATYITFEYKRSLTIDYSKKPKTRIPVVLPALFVWILAASVAIPSFIFSEVLPLKSYANICGMISFYAIQQENYYIVQSLILSIRIALPTFLIVLTLLLLFCKRCQIRNRDYTGLVDENVSHNIKLAAYLTISYITFSLQKLYSSLITEVFREPFIHIKYPHIPHEYAVLLVLLYYLPSTFIRPFTYLLFNENINKAFKKNFLNYKNLS